MATTIKELMAQYGGNPADAPYWENQLASRGVNAFLTSPSFQNMTGKPYTGFVPDPVATTPAATTTPPAATSSPALPTPGAALDFSGVGDPYSVSASKTGIDPRIQTLLDNVTNQAAGNIGAGNDPTSISTSSTGFDPGTFSTAQNFLTNLNQSVPQYNQAVQNFMGLPDKIDQYTSDQVKNYRLRGDDIISVLNEVANRRSKANILGGTESENLRSNMLSQLMQGILGQQAAADAQGTQLKTQAITGLPGASALPLNALTSLIPGLKTSQGTATQTDPTAWADTVAQLLGLNKQADAFSYQTDPTAMAQIMASLLQSNY